MHGSIKMFADLFCRGWNSIRVRFWSIGYKKRLLLQLLIVLFIALGGFLLWTSLFTNLADLNFIQKEDGNGSTIWDKWVQENGLKSIGDIWDGCDPNKSRKKIGKVVIRYDSEQRRVIATAVANFTAKVSLNSGAVHVVAKYRGRTLHDVKHDICKVNADTFGCPMKRGQKMHVYEPIKLPKIIPRGEYFATAKVLNEDEVCLGMTESNIIL